MLGAVPPIRILPSEAELGAIGPVPKQGQEFFERLHRAMDDVVRLQGEAETQVVGALKSWPEAQKAISVAQTADLGFELLLQVRNRVISAYEEISRTQL